MATLAKAFSRRPTANPKAPPQKSLPYVGKMSSVASAKANLSALLKSVEKNREEVTLLRRGIPVARIVPIAESVPVSGYGWMRGSVHELGDIVGPTGEEWDAGNA
jgi:prevent-host-death family protein